MSKFERQFTAGMAGSLPAGVAAYERFAERAAQDKRYAKAEERQAAQDARQAKQDEESTLDRRIRYGGYNPADISAGADQRALLGEPELAGLQSAMAKGQAGIPSKYAGGKYNPKAEATMQGFEGFLSDKTKGKTFEQEKELIRLRGKNSKPSRDYTISELTNQIKVLGDRGIPVQDLVDELRRKQSLAPVAEPFREQKFFESDAAYAKAQAEAGGGNKPSSDSQGLYP